MRFPGSIVPALAVLLLGSVAPGAQLQSPPRAPAVAKPIPPASAYVPPPSSALAGGGADDCSQAGAHGIIGPGFYFVDTTSASSGPQIGIGCTQAHRDVWFLWTAMATGTVELRLCSGTTTDTVIAVWAGTTCPSGTPLACDDDGCGLQSRVVFPVVNGASYLFQIGVYGASTSPGFGGSFEVVALPPPPLNDECANATVVAGVGTFPFDNATATTSADGQTESPCLIYGTTDMQRDVWFTWTAPSSGVVVFTTCALTMVDTKIAAYPGGGCPAPGSALACADDTCPAFESSVEFNVTAGAQYALQIGVFPGANGGTGSFSLTLPPPPPPPVPADLNVDVGSPSSPSGTPSMGYGAAGRAGTWNVRSATVSSSQLLGVDGLPSGAVLTRTVATPHDLEFVNTGAALDDAALLNDAQDVGGLGGTTTWTFSNLYGGNYAVYTYAWAPDGASYRSLVSVQGSSDVPQSVGGAWPGGLIAGVTHALHRVDSVPTGGSIAVTVATSSGYGTLNGFQLVEQPVPFTPYCFGDGSGAPCPCANTGSAGNGCANSVNAAGARLLGTGVASVTSDSLRLVASGMPNSSCLFFQGTTASAVSFGDGLRCAAGVLIRLGTKSNLGGSSRYPEAGDAIVSVRGLIPPGGGVRRYQSWYRNAAVFCTAATYNLTNGVEVPWQP